MHFISLQQKNTHTHTRQTNKRTFHLFEFQYLRLPFFWSGKIHVNFSKSTIKTFTHFDQNYNTPSSHSFVCFWTWSVSRSHHTTMVHFHSFTECKSPLNFCRKLVVIVSDIDFCHLKRFSQRFSGSHFSFTMDTTTKCCTPSIAVRLRAL